MKRSEWTRFVTPLALTVWLASMAGAAFADPGNCHGHGWLIDGEYSPLDCGGPCPIPAYNCVIGSNTQGGYDYCGCQEPGGTGIVWELDCCHMTINPLQSEGNPYGVAGDCNPPASACPTGICRLMWHFENGNGFAWAACTP